VSTRNHHSHHPWLRLVLSLGVVAAALIAAPLSQARMHTTHHPAPRARNAWQTAGWVTTWATSPTQGGASQNDVTIRNIVYPSVGGSSVRVRLSNVFGTQPLVVGSASIGVELQGAITIPGTLHALTFAGKAGVTIPPGQEVLSDPLAYNVRGEEDLAISVYLPQDTGPLTYHGTALQDNWISSPGDFTMSADGASFPTDSTSWWVVDGLIVKGSPRVLGTVVALGDSITEGDYSEIDANQRWPNVLGDRLARQHGDTLAVVDEGIGGNRLLNDSPCFGQSGLNRFQRDVLGQPGVRDVIVLLGTNDLYFNNINATTFPSEYSAIAPCLTNPAPITAAEMITAFETLAAQAHHAGVRIFAATITPFHGSALWDPAEEQTREAINHWILTNHVLDGGFDFASAVADPYAPLYMDPKYVSGDTLEVHPNDAGYHAIAHTITLSSLLGNRERW
jgi:lysophospholipase L1-like esterase